MIERCPLCRRENPFWVYTGLNEEGAPLQVAVSVSAPAAVPEEPIVIVDEEVDASAVEEHSNEELPESVIDPNESPHQRLERKRAEV